METCFGAVYKDLTYRITYRKAPLGAGKIKCISYLLYDSYTLNNNNNIIDNERRRGRDYAKTAFDGAQLPRATSARQSSGDSGEPKVSRVGTGAQEVQASSTRQETF